METENRGGAGLAGGRRRWTTPEESMEGLVHSGEWEKSEEGEVVRGRGVEVRDSEVLVKSGYKSEGTSPRGVPPSGHAPRWARR